jgi:hypothetical protein
VVLGPAPGLDPFLRSLCLVVLRVRVPAQSAEGPRAPGTALWRLRREAAISSATPAFGALILGFVSFPTHNGISGVSPRIRCAAACPLPSPGALCFKQAPALCPWARGFEAQVTRCSFAIRASSAAPRVGSGRPGDPCAATARPACRSAAALAFGPPGVCHSLACYRIPI